MSSSLKLQGQFKFDLYDISGNLLKSSNFQKNFITNSGLTYPLHFAFADCFRFLSAGSGDAGNSILVENETTGLQIPVPELSYIGGRNNFGNPNSTNYSPFPSCGYRFSNDNVVELYRTWTLPNNSGGEIGSFKTSGTLKEFMVSPGRPYVVYEDGTGCSCNEIFYPGKDCSSTADYYNYINSIDSRRLKICDATKAFARVLYTQDYESGTILNITYKLTISINTGLRYQEMDYNNTSSQDGNFSGYWNLLQGVTQPGLKLINDGLVSSSLCVAPNYQTRLQQFGYNTFYIYDFTNEYGESFVPPHGIPLEPSVHNLNSIEVHQNIFHYFSQDNIQFLVSESGGKFNNTGEFAPWNFYSPYQVYSLGDYSYSGNYTYKYKYNVPNSGIPLNDSFYWENLGYLKVVSSINSGIKKYKNDLNKVFSEKNSYWYNRPEEFNIRYSGIKIPSSDNILNEVNFTKSINSTFTRGTISTGIIKTSNLRTVYVNRNINFLGYPFASKFYIKNFVSAYKDCSYGVNSFGGDSGNLVPFLDSIFSGTGQGILVPPVITGIKDYGDLENTGAFISGADSEKYFYFSSNQARYPILTTSLLWSSDCPPGTVSGCS